MKMDGEEWLPTRPIETWTAGPKQGWECPVCHMGNAPWATKCFHCDDARRRDLANPDETATGE